MPSGYKSVRLCSSIIIIIICLFKCDGTSSSATHAKDDIHDIEIHTTQIIIIIAKQNLGLL
jgi:hypothetical protein